MLHALALEMGGARHITGHLLAKEDVSPEKVTKIFGHESDVYMHYYPVIWSEMASQELQRKYRPIKRKES